MPWRARVSALLPLVGRLRRVVAWLLPPSAPPDQVPVAIAENEPQAELMTQLLHQEGIACNYQSVGGVGLWAPWNPAGPRELIVNASDAARAKDVLSRRGAPDRGSPPDRATSG
jgi:hypothetical protein